MSANDKAAVGRIACAVLWAAAAGDAHARACADAVTPPVAAVARRRPIAQRRLSRRRLPAPLRRSTFTCSGPPEFARLSYPLRHTARRIAGGEPLTIVAVGSSSTSGRRREFAGGELSEPPRRRAQATLSGARHHRAQSRRRRRRDPTDDGAVRYRRHRRASRSRALAGRHQFRAARSSAQAAFRPAARGHRATQGSGRRRGADGYAVCAARAGQVRDARAWKIRSHSPPKRRASICSIASR